MNKQISIICALTSLATLGRVSFAAIPSVQLTTFVVLVSGHVYGPRIGLTVGVLAACCSNMILGQGPWTIYQAISWGLAGVSAGILQIVLSRSIKPTCYAQIVLTIHSFLWGFFFGWITNLWHFYAFVYPHNWRTWLAVCLTSLPFDLAHATTNAIALKVLGPRTMTILEYYRDKFQIVNI